MGDMLYANINKKVYIPHIVIANPERKSFLSGCAFRGTAPGSEHIVIRCDHNDIKQKNMIRIPLYKVYSPSITITKVTLAQYKIHNHTKVARHALNELLEIHHIFAPSCVPQNGLAL